MNLLVDPVTETAIASLSQPGWPILTDPTFQAFALGAGMILLTAGALLLLLRKKLGQDGFRTVWQTYRSWWIMIPLCLGTLVAGRIGVILGLAMIALMGVRELAAATGLYRDWWMTGAVYLGLAAVALAGLVQDPRLGTPGWYGLFMALPVYVVGLILIVPIFRNRSKGQLQSICLALLSFIYFGWMFGHLGFLANAEGGLGYLLYICSAVIALDVGAYTFGRLFGRRPLRSNISPNKTLEGALGAWALAMAWPWLLSFALPGFGTFQLVLTGLIVGLGGQLGDLAISTIKRDLQVKDLGQAIPGHGGVLDRIDSLIFVAPLYFHMIRWTEGLG